MTGNSLYIGFLFLWILIFTVIFQKSMRRESQEYARVNSFMLGAEELEKYAAQIARNHQLADKAGSPRDLVARLDDNYQEIISVYKSLTTGNRRDSSLTPSAEWLLDNFYIIEEQVKIIRRDLIKHRKTELGLLKGGYLKGFPRIYAVALEMVAHLDGKLEAKTIIGFLKAYQSQTVLAMSELWILPLMLEAALIENIRTLCERVIVSYVERQKVEWLFQVEADELAGALVNDISRMRGVSPPYIERLIKKLRQEVLDHGQILRVLDGKLEQFDTSAELVVQEEHLEQATRQLTMGNSILSLKYIANLGWSEVFEQVSRVDDILRHDPLAVYSQMDFDSRNYYRQELQKLAELLQLSETNVARKAVEMAKQAADQGEPERKTHVGYYLVEEEGRLDLAREIDERIEPDRWKQLARKWYFPLISLITTGLILIGCLYAWRAGGASLPQLTGVAFVLLIPALSMAVDLVNWWMMRLTGPKILPSLKLKQGLPAEAAAAVVIPALLHDARQACRLVDQLEIHYLANGEENLCFIILGDFPDSDRERQPGDGETVAAVLERVRLLNEKYSPQGDVFYYFQRGRKYAVREKAWRGWERKRGAVAEFTQMIRGRRDTSYSWFSADPAALNHLQYVVTVNEGTRTPIGVVKRMVGTITHPLNKAVLNGSWVVAGYGLIQPRISVDLEMTNSSFFSRIYSGQTGYSPDTQAKSDIYQDLFDEGSFTGQGIFQIDAFLAAMTGSIPDDTVLSPEGITGGYLRVGLATRLELVATFPTSYLIWMTAIHRRVRGDWQLLPWLLPKVMSGDGYRTINPLSRISRWKILNNIRESLEPISIFLLLTLGLTLFPGEPAVWLGFSLLSLLYSLILDFISYLLSKHYSLVFYRNYGNYIFGSQGAILQTAQFLATMPFAAYMMADAICRTLYRKIFSGKNLWQWVSSVDAQRQVSNEYRLYLQRMYPALLISLGFFTLVIFASQERLVFSLPLLLLWILSPVAAYYVSQPDKADLEPLEQGEMDELRRLAQRTWHYYEDFVTPENNFLPPDNFQEDPFNGVATRTSPTNIGLALLAVLAARDMGFISLPEMVGHLQNSLASIEKLEKWNGHLFNWYDTRTRQVLRPRYISSVDSGNFLSHLLTLRQGILDHLHQPLVYPDLAKGLEAALVLAEQESSPEMAATRRFLAAGDLTLAGWRQFLDQLPDGRSCRSPWERRCLKMTGSLKEEIETLLPAKEAAAQLRLLCPAGNRGVQAALDGLLANPSLTSLADAYQELLQCLDAAMVSDPVAKQVRAVREHLTDKKGRVDELLATCHGMVERIDRLAAETQLRPLYHSGKHLFSIGYNLEEEKQTDAYYDLLASEARITSYLGVIRREVPVLHWYKLGRALVDIEGYRGLVSWTGTMFEYFMPSLIMKNFRNTLLDETYHFVLDAQQIYGERRNVPWGTSESGYYAFDLQLNYQYQAFGVPDLGLKRGLIRDIVVSPYSSVLGISFDPRGCMENIKRLTGEGLMGYYGFYEAVDYTPEHLPEGKARGLVKSYMAHHQGMIFLALNNYLRDKVMQQRFHHNPLVQAGELLLQERIPPRTIVTKEYKEPVTPMERPSRETVQVVRNFGLVDSGLPACHLLSNRKYAILVTNTGSGFSRWEGLQVSRWREESIESKSGCYIFLHQVNSGRTWSATYEPFDRLPDDYQVTFAPHKADYMHIEGEIGSRLEVFISPEDDAEIRRLSLQNHGQEAVDLEVTSYFEVVLTSQAADVAHPAFSNLFVRTEFVPKTECLLAARRPRSAGQGEVWAVHSMILEGESVGGLEYETDRSRFIGRGRDISCPQALEGEQPLSNTAGPVLDPMMGLRRRIRLLPGQSARVSFIIGIAASRQTALSLAERYDAGYSMDRAIELSASRADVETGYLGLKGEELVTVQNLIAHLVFLSPLRRKYQEFLLKNRKGQPGLWPYGISGDLPIILLVVADADELALVRRMLKAHEYCRLKGFNADLVILDREEGGYLQPTREAIRDLILNSYARNLQNVTGGVYALSASVLPEDDIALLYAAARVVLQGGAGPIAEQLRPEEGEPALPALLAPAAVAETYPPREEEAEPVFANGLGGFSPDGREYRIRLGRDRHTPAPWLNVVANPDFGFQVSESGAGFTWAENSRENKLTPWFNDPVTDNPGEIFYLRDEESGRFWSMTALPVREQEPYTIVHGQGYSIFRHDSHGIDQELTMFVPREDGIKVNLVSLVNHTDRERHLKLTHYLWPVLGVSEQQTQMHIITDYLPEEQVLLIRNPYNSDFPGRIVVCAISAPVSGYTGDREEFIGRGHDLKNPLAMARAGLSNRTGAGFNPCAALETVISLMPGEKSRLVVLLAQAMDLPAAKALVEKYRSLPAADAALAQVKAYWTEKLGTVQVKTPDPSMDTLLNGWLLYQSMTCRLWARSAFYQSGGAYGFRDQLQDVLSVLHCAPELARRQILLHCAHQFVEGDVQHWWHPGAGDKGIRTRFSDDLLWLPYVASEYLRKTGDMAILTEEVAFLEDDPLEEGQDERYGIPRLAEEKASVYQHCLRAIDRSLRFGSHGIPLMGSGDWNDGMNTVGNLGRGESIWLGWFLCDILQRFARICESLSDQARGEKYREQAGKIALNIETNAWDGSWYRRAYFDDGTPLGSAENTECKIDSLAQSWAAISGFGQPDRVRQAMAAVEHNLVRREDGLIMLFTPPFDAGELEPGYIKGYLPGVRENGGQYTHAAVWVVYALAKMGLGSQAADLYHLINPLNHARTPMECANYKVEPYVMAADIYAVSPHIGRGGWTWYTGAAGWMYTVGLEWILGLQMEKDRLRICPCIPPEWEGYTIDYRYGSTLYRIQVTNRDKGRGGEAVITIDGQPAEGETIPLLDDQKTHRIDVVL